MNLSAGYSRNSIQTELLAALVESSGDAIFAKDIDGIIQAWNKGAERIYGYSSNEVIGRQATILLPPDRVHEESEILAAIRRGESFAHFESIRLRKDGTHISVSLTISPIRNEGGEIVGASHIARNITERTLMEAATAQLAAIVDSSDDAIVSKSLDGTILTWNAGAERLYGYSAAEVRGKHMSILLPPGRPDEETSILDSLRRGQRVDHFETVRRRKDDRLIDVSLTISPIRDRDGSVRGASHVARDITERKLLERQLLQTQKLESLGVLAGGIAHDFNNLLVGILSNASLLESSLPESDPRKPAISEVVASAERAAALTQQLLAYAGKGALAAQTMNLPSRIRETCVLIKGNIPGNVRLDLILNEDTPPIEGDLVQLQQVIMNLVINAAESMGGKAGLVAVSCRTEDLTARQLQEIEAKIELRPGAYALIEVRDTGCGMDQATVQKIFDPFFTTKFAGRGLGLAAVLGIVNGHKGALSVTSTPGEGTTFRVYLPAAGRAAVLDLIPPIASELAGNGTVLVIDDEEIVGNAARLSLQRYGYHVLVANDAHRAVDIFRQFAQDVSLVLLDLTMPGATGSEIFSQLRSIRPSVPVILSSGFSESEAAERFPIEAASGFLQKPYTSRNLAARVRDAISAASR